MLLQCACVSDYYFRACALELFCRQYGVSAFSHRGKITRSVFKNRGKPDSTAARSGLPKQGQTYLKRQGKQGQCYENRGRFPKLGVVEGLGKTGAKTHLRKNRGIRSAALLLRCIALFLFRLRHLSCSGFSAVELAHCADSHGG